MGDPVVERIMRQLVEAAGLIVASRNASGSGLIAPSGLLDDAGRVELSAEVTKKPKVKTATTTESAQGYSRNRTKKPMKNLSRVLDMKKYNQIQNSFIRVPDTVREHALMFQLGILH